MIQVMHDNTKDIMRLRPTYDQLQELSVLSGLLGVSAFSLIPLDLAAEVCAREYRKSSQVERARWALRYHARKCKNCVLQAASTEDILCKLGGKIAKAGDLHPAVVLDY